MPDLKSCPFCGGRGGTAWSFKYRKSSEEHQWLKTFGLAAFAPAVAVLLRETIAVGATLPRSARRKPSWIQNPEKKKKLSPHPPR